MWSPLVTNCHCHGWMITSWWTMALSHLLAKSPHQLLSSGGGYISIVNPYEKNPCRAVTGLRGSRSSDGAPERKSRKARLCPTVDVESSTGVFRVEQFQGFQIFSVVTSDKSPTNGVRLEHIRVRETLERRDRSWNEPSKDGRLGPSSPPTHPWVMYRWYVCRTRRHHWQKGFNFFQEKWKRRKKRKRRERRIANDR